MRFTSTGTELKSESKVRENPKPEITCSPEEFVSYRKRYKSNLVVLSESPTEVKFLHKKSKWKKLEDDTWLVFKELGYEDLPIGSTVLDLGGGITRQIDGLFVDSEHIFVVECKYKERKNGQNQPPGDIIKDIQQWNGQWKRVKEKLQTIDLFMNKIPVFVLITRGVKWNEKLETEIKNLDGSLVDETQLISFRNMTKSLGCDLTRMLFKKELFEHNPKLVNIKGDEKTVLCTSSVIDSYQIFQFFISPTDLVKRAHIPRRMPTGGDITNAYQRSLKFPKVNQIKNYLSEKGNFFPNSIICATKDSIKQSYVEEIRNEDTTSIGKLTLPHKYGSLFVIDGQHRLFGSIGAKKRKLVNVTLITKLDQRRQAQLFTTINQKASKIDPDLMWDLYGDIDTSSDPKTRSEIDMTIRKITSNVWKRINQQKDHPLNDRIFVPSHSFGSKRGKISFGNTLCKYLHRNKKNWESGFLRVQKWSKSENFCFKRVSHFYKVLGTNPKLSNEWKKGSGGFILNNYSIIVISIVFTHMVQMFGGQPSTKDTWRNKPEVLIDDFVNDLTNSIIDPNSGFYNPTNGRDIRNAGSSALREKYAKDLIINLRSNHHKYKELAPHVKEAKEGDRPSIEIRNLVEDVEVELRARIFEELTEEYEDQWTKQLNGDVRSYVERQIQEKKSIGEHEDYKFPYNKNYLDLTTTSHIKIILESKFFKSRFPDMFGTTFSKFENSWPWYNQLRNIIAHNNPYPNVENTKQLMINNTKFLHQMIFNNNEEE